MVHGLGDRYIDLIFSFDKNDTDPVTGGQEVQLVSATTLRPLPLCPNV